MFEVSKSRTEIELYGDIPGSGYGLTKAILKPVVGDWHLWKDKLISYLHRLLVKQYATKKGGLSSILTEQNDELFTGVFA